MPTKRKCKEKGALPNSEAAAAALKLLKPTELAAIYSKPKQLVLVVLAAQKHPQPKSAEPG